MVRYQTIPKFAEESGYTEAAINSKIRDGIWLENVVWLKAPDGRRLIDVEEYYKWVETVREPRQSAKRQSKSHLSFVGSAAANESSSPLPLRI